MNNEKRDLLYTIIDNRDESIRRLREENARLREQLAEKTPSPEGKPGKLRVLGRYILPGKTGKG